MIERLQVRGYKSLLDVDVQLGPLTVFVGANGSGKTSVLEAIGWLRKLALRTTQQLWLPDLSRVASRQREEAAIHINALLTEFEEQGFLVSTFEHRQTRLQFEGGAPILLCENSRVSKSDVPESVSRAMEDGIQMFRLDAGAMADASYSDETNPRLDFDGNNLASVLDALQGEARERFDEIERRLRDFIPSLSHLRVKRTRTRRDGGRSRHDERPDVVGHQVSFDFENASNIRADDASEGTVILLGLLTVIEANEPDQPLTIMLDDLDRALHPKAQRELVGYLHELIRSRPNLQIIATTHSPYLVEHLEFEEVRAITQASDGSSVIGALTDHPEAERWREEMSAGEFWSSVGESWVAAQRSGT